MEEEKEEGKREREKLGWMDFYLGRNTPSAIGPAHVMSSEGEENSLIFLFLGGILRVNILGKFRGYCLLILV